MADPTPDPLPRFRMTSLLRRSPAAAFVLSGNGRLRYANAAWERLTGRSLAKFRGTRVSSTRESASPLWRTLGPPAEVWAGQTITVRRPPPDTEFGPPWWDVSFLPVPGTGRPVAIVGTITVVGERPARGEYREPAAIAALRQQNAATYSFDLLNGRSAAAEKLLQQARHVAGLTVPVWLIGGPGAGKTTFARIVHHNGPFREKAFVKLDAARLEPYLADGLLFGKGGLLAGKAVGTVYLAQPAAWPRDLQDKVACYFHENRPAGPRLICGSESPASHEHTKGRLITRFHTGLSVLEIRIPPLHERPADLAHYVERLLPRFVGPSNNRSVDVEELVTPLAAYPWPGNVRELADVIATAVATAADGPIEPTHLPRRVREHHLIVRDPRPPAGHEWSLDELLETTERRLIGRAVRDARGSLSAAAERLGIPRTRLGRRLEALGLSPDGRSDTP